MHIERYRTITLVILIFAFTGIYYFSKYYYSKEEIVFVEREVIEGELNNQQVQGEESNLFDRYSEKYRCIEGMDYYVKGNREEGQIALPSYGQIRKDGGAVYSNALLTGDFKYLIQKTELFILDKSIKYSDMIYDKLFNIEEKITKTNIVFIVQEETEKNYALAKDLFIEDVFIKSKNGNDKIFYHVTGCNVDELEDKFIPRYMFTYKSKKGKFIALGEIALRKEERKEKIFKWSENGKYFFNEIDSTVIDTAEGKDILQSINSPSHGKWTGNNILYVRGAGKYDDNIYKFNPLKKELEEIFYLEGEQIPYNKLEKTDLITTAFSIDEEKNIIKASFFRTNGNVNYEIKIEMDLKGNIISKTKREYL